MWYFLGCDTKSAWISFLSGSSTCTSSSFNSEFFSKIILLIAATVDPFLIDLLLAAFEEMLDLLLICYVRIKFKISPLWLFLYFLLQVLVKTRFFGYSAPGYVSLLICCNNGRESHSCTLTLGCFLNFHI